eukprot:SAG31_NODE_21259_length_554_cov_0.518681_2_plen_123_part_01
MVDLRYMNEFSTKMSTRFETLKDAKRVARPGDYMLSFDLEDGYHAIGIHPDSQRFMTFSIRGQLYSCCSLPFGWSCAPAVFCKVMQTLTTSLRSPDLQPVTAIPHHYHGGELPEAQQGLSQHL